MFKKIVSSNNFRGFSQWYGKVFYTFLYHKKTLFFLILPFLMIVHSLVFAQGADERITITTYYPSPAGVYNQLQTNSLGVGDNDGDGKLDSGDVPITPGDVWIKGKVGIGTTNPLQTIDIPTGGAYGYNGKKIAYGNTNLFNYFFGGDAGNPTMTGLSNTAVGARTLQSNTTGYFNTAIGDRSLQSSTRGYLNTAVGKDSLGNNTIGYQNTAVGIALLHNTTGYENTAVGASSLFNSLGGRSNTAIGMESLSNNTAGSYNTASGYQAGLSITTGNSNTFLGSSAGYNASQKPNAINSMALGAGAYTTADNQVVIGNTSVTQTLLHGNVGIKTVNPTSLLDVGSSVDLGGPSYVKVNAAANQIAGFSVAEGGTNLWYLYRPNDGTQDLRLNNGPGDVLVVKRATGNVGIGTMTPGTYKIYINGTGKLNAASWDYSSDRRLKENISSIQSGLSIIEQLKPVRFDYIKGDKKQAGFIAQDVEKVLPDVITKGEDGMLGMKTESIIPYLVKAIQEQQEEINTLKAKFSAKK